jgi:hypothetical protein
MCYINTDIVKVYGGPSCPVCVTQCIRLQRVPMAASIWYDVRGCGPSTIPCLCDTGMSAWQPRRSDDHGSLFNDPANRVRVHHGWFLRTASSGGLLTLHARSALQPIRCT